MPGEPDMVALFKPQIFHDVQLHGRVTKHKPDVWLDGLHHLLPWFKNYEKLWNMEKDHLVLNASALNAKGACVCVVQSDVHNKCLMCPYVCRWALSCLEEFARVWSVSPNIMFYNICLNLTIVCRFMTCC